MSTHYQASKANQNDNSSSKKHQPADRMSMNPDIHPEMLQWAIQNSRSARPETILQLQRLYGNRAVSQMIAAADKRAAQRLLDSEQVVGPGEVENQQELPPVGGNSGLPQDVQAKMESAFNTDFSDVKILVSSLDATHLGARAYTQGNEIHFAPGKFQPETQEGQKLLGHELTHIVQQRQGRVKPTIQTSRISVNLDAGLEKEADEAGAKAAKGQDVSQVAGKSPLKGKSESVVQGQWEWLGGGLLAALLVGLTTYYFWNRAPQPREPEYANWRQWLRNLKTVPGAESMTMGQGSTKLLKDASEEELIAYWNDFKKAQKVDVPHKPRSEDDRTYRTVKIDIIKLAGSTRDVDADIKTANEEVYFQAKIKIVKGEEKQVDAIATANALRLGNRLVVESNSDGKTPTQDELKVLALHTPSTPQSIPVFYVKGLGRQRPTQFDEDADRGESFLPSNGRLGVLIANSALPTTLAHELGHVIMDSGKHIDDDPKQASIEPNDPEFNQYIFNLMVTVTPLREAPFFSYLTKDQIGKMLQSAFVK